MLLTALEIVCFGAISFGVAIAAWAVAGVPAAVAGGLITLGGSGVYLVNAYALTGEEETDDA